MLSTGRYLRPLLKMFSWIILSLSLLCNRTVKHVLVNKIIVSWIISDTTVCVNEIWSLTFFPLFLSSFSHYLENSFETFLNIKWRQEICCIITNWRKNVYHGISQLIQYFSIELYSQLVSFYGNIFSPSSLF